VTGGIPDQDDAGRDGMIDPDVVVGIAVARTRRPGLCQRGAMRQRRQIKGLQKPLDCAVAGKPVALIDPMRGIEPYPTATLREHIEADVAVDANRLFVVRPVVGVIDQ
jgi:hypothetical protein